MTGGIENTGEYFLSRSELFVANLQIGTQSRNPPLPKE